MSDESVLAVEEAAESNKPCFANSLEHVLAELRNIDLLIQTRVRQSQQSRKPGDRFRGLYLSDADVEEILRTPFGGLRNPLPLDAGSVSATFERMRAATTARVRESQRRGIRLRLLELVEWFGLSLFDSGCLLICLAPEFDSRYGRLFGFVHDDVTKKRPTIELVLNLLCPDLQCKVEMRRRLIKPAPLPANLLVEPVTDSAQQAVTFPETPLRIDRRIAEFMLGGDGMDERVQPMAQLVDPSLGLSDIAMPEDLKRRVLQLGGGATAFILYFHGPDSSTARYMAEALCRDRRELGRQLMVVDGARALSSEIPFAELVTLLVREARLQEAGICWTHFDGLLAEDKRASLQALWSRLRDFPGIVILSGEQAWEPTGDLAGRPFLRIEVPRPGYTERRRLWTSTLAGASSDLDIADIAGRFRLTTTQIRGAAATAHGLARSRGVPEVSTEDLYQACRLHSNRNLSNLAHKIEPRFGWDDIILPPERVEQLREICNWLKYRTTVYEDWGFDRKLALGRGLYVLFAGPSGTGKTMAADIMAGQLGLELYKIDLSAMVSKYIGETEKNLAKIFQEAETSNAILFFDEADALFGKRSEVRDSHDRYANIEIAYLLQRMEEHEGVVILATNFRKNMDDAFVRRLQFCVDFPFPNEVDRRRMWESIWPARTPRTAGLDLDFLSKRYEISGGNIRNIALGAAFLAADSGGAVGMDHVLQAVRREFQKMGKVSSPGEFGYEARS